ncbi:hypothetical protein, partial [Sphingomonas sp. CCH20-B6]|uniref:hypothetical protein n=1 Tax=Sphingomonas sp. CCH20-B6 TaxID=1768769 RepID=UPI0009EA5CFE
ADCRPTASPPDGGDRTLTCILRIRCACGRARSVQLGAFARENAIPADTQIYKLILRLRCRCGLRPSADVTRSPYG